MALYRKNRELLSDSLRTSVIVKNINDLRHAIIKQYSDDPMLTAKNFENFKIKISIPYNGSLEESFDDRCGWYTHIVCCNIFNVNEFWPCGFLSEPLE